MTTLRVRGGREIDGTAVVPGDKSISHRALLLGAAAHGTSIVSGLGPGQDVAATRRCLSGYGVVFRDTNGTVEIDGRGVDAFTQPDGPLDCANSGTTMRLLAGFAARVPLRTVFDGDGSLRGRPMDRITRPLTALGARAHARDGRYPPVEIEGGKLTGAEIDMDVVSAQVKSCVLLAGLGAVGTTTVIEPIPTRDHTERMLDALGAPLFVDGRRITVKPFEPQSFTLDVAGDVSSASFLVAAAVLAGRVRIENVGLNSTRIAFLRLVVRMGGAVTWKITEDRLGEPVGWIEALRSDLRAVDVAPPEIALVLDEVPLLAVLATAADGVTTITGASELRIKESDRITALAQSLGAMGATFDERDDGFAVEGPVALRGALVGGAGDHRIAMALAVAGLRAEGETIVEGADVAAVSWPGFAETLTAMGADLQTT